MIEKKWHLKPVEIAVLLAVAILIIGGVYMAIAGVAENSRRKTMRAQVLAIASNVRAVYATQASYATPTLAVQKQMGLFPADMPTDADGRFLNAYGGTTTLSDVPASDQQFTITFGGVSQGACIDLLSKTFGSGTLSTQLGLAAAGEGADATANAATGGIAPSQAAGVCDAAGNTNSPFFTFNLRGQDRSGVI